MIITTVRSPLASTVLNLGASELTCTSESERVEPGSDQSSHLAHDGPGRVPGDTGDHSPGAEGDHIPPPVSVSYLTFRSESAVRVRRLRF